MQTVNAYAAPSPTGPLEATSIERRDVGARDVLIDISYAGICHSDIHTVRGDWGPQVYPLVPGHEIVGTVAEVGSEVTGHAVGDRVGVGCMVGSCRECDSCRKGEEQYCHAGPTMTYGAVDADGSITQGGYSTRIVVDEHFVLKVPEGIPFEAAAPLLCAGITTYTPLRHWKAGPRMRVGVLGFGGLGHVGVPISAALGAHTTAFDITPAKEADAYRRGADDYRLSTDPSIFDDFRAAFDLIVSTVPANVDYDAFLGLLALDGTFVNVGVPKKPITLDVFSLLNNRRSLSGTLVGNIAETQEMLDFCARHGIAAEVEVVGADEIDEAFDRLAAGDVRYRFVIDVATMAGG